MNNIQNPKVEILETIEMNDENYLNDLLESIKNMSDNLSIALNEASNETLYSKIKVMFDDVKSMQRELFELSFSLGWYKLQKADNTQIKQKEQELSQKLNQLIK
jgi:spore coat protein CotF